MIKKLLGFIFTAGILLSMAFTSVSAADFTWNISDQDVILSVPGQTIDTASDGDPGTYFDGNNLYLIYTTATNKWKRYVGTGMDDLQELPDSKLVGFDYPHDDDRYWLCGLWVDETTGTWYTTVHDEFNYNDGKVHERYIQYATSDDKGEHWYLQDVIISGDTPEYASEHSGRYESFGNADQKLYADTKTGYFYMYYMKSWIDKETGYMWKTWQVARSPMSEKLKAGTWQKWYKGEWSEPGIGGHDSPLFAPPSTGAFVFYSTYLERYVALGMQKESNHGFISTCTDLSKNDWTTPQKFIDKSRMGWYSWVMDPETWSRDTIGKNFRYYSTASNVLPPKYIDVSFGQGETTEADAEYFYPDYSTLKDYIPDYNDIIDFVPDYAYREDFSHSTDAWKAIDGKGKFVVERQQHAMKITPCAENPVVFAPDDAPQLKDCTIEYSVVLNGGKKFGHVFGVRQDGTYNSLIYDNGQFYLVTSGGEKISLFEFSLKANGNKAYRIKAVTLGNRLSVSIDGNLMFDDTVEGFSAAIGGVGLIGFPDSCILYDDLAFYDGIEVMIDDVPIAFNTKPQIINGYTMVPMRKIFELFGADVSYDSANQQITAVKGNTSIIITVGSDKAILNGKEIGVSTPAIIQNDNVLVPVRLISETLGANVNWNNARKRVEINSNGNLRIKLQKLEPLPTEECFDTSAIGYIDDLKNASTTFKTIGAFSVKNDNRPEYDIAVRIYPNANSSFERIYELSGGQVDTIKTRIYAQGKKTANLSVFVSADGEDWQAIQLSETGNSVEDSNMANMYFMNMEQANNIPKGMRFVKVKVAGGNDSWALQLVKVSINEDAVEQFYENLQNDHITDYLRDFTKTESVKGLFISENDKRSEYGTVRRIYKESAVSENYLIYKYADNAIKQFSAIVYTKGENVSDYFTVYLSKDGKTWDKTDYDINSAVRDSSNTQMYISEISAAFGEETEYHYVKIVFNPYGENWAGQLMKAEIL